MSLIIPLRCNHNTQLGSIAKWHSLRRKITTNLSFLKNYSLAWQVVMEAPEVANTSFRSAASNHSLIRYVIEVVASLPTIEWVRLVGLHYQDR